MIDKEGCMEIQILHRQGMSVRNIAEQTGLSINTVRKYLHHKGPVHYTPRSRPACKLDPFLVYLQDRVSSAQPDWLPATVLFREIHERGYEGGLSQLRAYLRTLKPVSKDDPLVRFETAPGQQMQVDWIEFRRKPRLSAFVATLGHSRHSYVEFVSDERIDSLLACHAHAFDFFEGVVKDVLYDNMKTVVIERDAYGAGRHRFNAGLWDFARHYGFQPKLCKPYRAKTKGKVERFNHYLRYSFFVPLASQLKQAGLVVDVATANQAVRGWLRMIANQRVHGTTGKVPQACWETERTQLQPLPAPYRGQIRAVQPALSEPIFNAAPTPMCVPPQHNLSAYDQLLEVAL